MCTIRTRWVAAATTSWMSCLIVASLVFATDESAQFQGPDISGLWQVEGELLRESGHRVLFAYGELRDEDYDEVMAIHFGDGEPPVSVVQRGGKVEGAAVRNVPCGEYPQVTYTGTVSEDNQVELTITIPGIEEFCNQDEKSDYFRDQSCQLSQTDWVASFEGIYDPTRKVITGTFTANQERDYRKCWKLDGSYWFEDKTSVKTSGALRIKVVKPWILIHGWKAGPEKWREWTTEDEGFLELEEDRIPYATVDLRPDADPNARARALAQEIEMIRIEKDWRDIKVNLVAHSQGGLDARAYLRDLGDKAKDQVCSLTMIGTPNHGTVVAYLAGVRYLTPRWVERFNRGTPKAEGVTYYTLAGSKVGPLSRLLWGEDDGIVPVSSVHLDDATALGCSPETAACPYEHNELVERREVYDAVKSQIDPDVPEEPNSLAFVAIKDGNVLTGQPVSEAVVVDGLKDVAFVIVSPSPLDLSLQSPHGERITAQTQDARVSHCAGEGLGLMAQSYVVRQPASGTWMAQVSEGIEGHHFTLLASAENTFALDGSADDYFQRIGEKVKLRAALSIDAGIADMWADITDPNGSRTTVVLYDDGLHEDDLAGDGVYGNVFFPSREGDYVLVFSATGVVEGKEFSRADLDSIFVEAAGVVEQ